MIRCIRCTLIFILFQQEKLNEVEKQIKTIEQELEKAKQGKIPKICSKEAIKLEQIDCIS